MFNLEKLESILESRGWSRYRLSKESGVSQTTLRDIFGVKKVSPTTKTLGKIADALNIPISSLLDDNFLNYAQRESIKNDSRKILDGNYSVNDKVIAVINLYKCDYYRSLEASGFDKTHVKLDDYISMRLSQEDTKNSLESDVYIKLVNKYGVSNSIKNGSTYFNCKNKISEKIKYQIEDLSKEEIDVITLFNQLNNIGKKKAFSYIEDLSKISAYQKADCTLPIAAHNDHYNKPDEIKKMLEDIEEL